MFKDQNLFFSDMMEKINTAKKDLEKNNETLEEAKNKINDFINDNTFEGEAATTVKTQMETYILVANAMIQANDCDIYDYITLENELNAAQNSVGGDDLIGEIIHEQMINAKRMEHEDRDKVKEYKKKQKESSFPFTDKYYALQVFYYAMSADDHKELWNEWHKRSEKYDEVERNTLNLFENGSQLRQKAENGLNELGKNYNGTSFDVNDDFTWKTDLSLTMDKYSKLTIFEEDAGSYWDEATGEWKKTDSMAFGGNQNWFDESKMSSEEKEMFKDHDLNEALKNGGCGVMALINSFYIMEGRMKVSKKEYMQRVYQFIKDNPKLRDKLLEKKKYNEKTEKYEYAGGLYSEQSTDNKSKKSWFSYVNAEDYLEDYMRENKICKNVEMEYIDDNSLQYIKNAKRPVYIDVQHMKNINLYSQDINTGVLSLDSKDEHDDSHAMIITGVKTKIDPKTKEKKEYLEVSTWGQKKYIPYDEIENNKNDIKISIYD